MRANRCLVSVLLVTIALLSTVLIRVPTAAATMHGEGTIPAFPGAEGFGAYTVGGRGGRVMEVTNLNDSGIGSLRACVEAEGPRICVFRTGGLIQLDTSLTVTHPYLTVAGQTAPGGGITLKNRVGGIGFNVKTHNVVIRYITSRPGPGGQNQAILVASNGGDVHNVVIDHCSLSWATDEVLTTWYAARDISLQWNIISEGLDCSTHPKGCHSKGSLLGGYASNEAGEGLGAERISFHHNLMAHNGERMPMVKTSGVMDVVNNVAYNPFWSFSYVDMTSKSVIPVNYVGNYFKYGPDSDRYKYEIETQDNGGDGTTIYVEGNVGPHRPSDDLPDYQVVEPVSRGYLMETRHEAAPVTTTSALVAYEQVLDGAGASKGLSCDGTWILRRDSVDRRIADEVRTGTGRIIDDPAEVGGWPAIDPGTPCPDGDHDGMPDEWELVMGLDRAADDSALDQDGDGYTNIEEYLNATGDVPSATFSDVPLSHPYFAEIEILYRAGYTAGCATDPLRYCPDQPMNRAESAVFVERGLHSTAYDPPVPASQVFADLSLDSWAAKWVNGLWQDQYTAGCGINPLIYCPWQGHSRAEGCVFYLRLLNGATFEPSQPTEETFADVPLEAWYARWVHAAYGAGLITACQTSPDLRFCPDGPLSRGLAAYMMVHAKGLQ